MKNLIEKLSGGIAAFLFCLFVPSASAQDGQTYGFLNFANLIPSEKNCKILLTGKDTVPNGLPAAQSTGWFIVPTGNLTISLEVEGFDKASGALDVLDNQSLILALYLEPSPGKDKEGKPLRPKIRMKRCDALTAKSGFALTFMSLCPGENRFSIGTSAVDAKLLDKVEVPGWTGGGFKILKSQQEVGKVETQLEKSAFYVFVGSDHAGKYCTSLVMAEKQNLPPWMKQKEPKP